MPAYGYNNVTQPAYANPMQGAAVVDYAGSNGGGFSPLSPGFDTSQIGVPDTGLGFNTDSLKLGLGAVQTLGSLWMAFKQNQLANKSLKLQTRAFDTNLKIVLELDIILRIDLNLKQMIIFLQTDYN
jgi:hypothetical protein